MLLMSNVNSIMKQTSTCNNNRAINLSNANWSNLAATGVGTCACAHHGAFVPHMMVDFQKEEWYR